MIRDFIDYHTLFCCISDLSMLFGYFFQIKKQFNENMDKSEKQQNNNLLLRSANKTKNL